MKLNFLNKKKIKEIHEKLKEQFGFSDFLDHAFLINEENAVFIVNKEIKDIDIEKMRINSLGLKFGEMMKTGFRLSIEGSQLIGPKSDKNIVELDDKEAKGWFNGDDIEKEIDVSGFVLLKSKKDFIGCSIYKNGKIINFVSKTRRVSVIEKMA